MATTPILYLDFSKASESGTLWVRLPGGHPADQHFLDAGPVVELAGRARRWAEDRGFALDAATSNIDAVQRADRPEDMLILGTKVAPARGASQPVETVM